MVKKLSSIALACIFLPHAETIRECLQGLSPELVVESLFFIVFHFYSLYLSIYSFENHLWLRSLSSYYC